MVVLLHLDIQLALQGLDLIVTLAHELQRRGGKYGVASLCIGGGQGGAVIIENLGA
jgi:acetyl-CoA C-acetyltransferase